MLRQLQVAEHKPVITCRAGEEMKTGMAGFIAVAAYEDMSLDPPYAYMAGPTSSSLTHDLHWLNAYMVDKPRFVDGVKNIKKNHSDYDDDFNTVREGEILNLIPMLPGELYATDQYQIDEKSITDSMLQNGRIPAYAMPLSFDSGIWTYNSQNPNPDHQCQYFFEGFMYDGDTKLSKIRVSYPYVVVQSN